MFAYPGYEHRRGRRVVRCVVAGAVAVLVVAIPVSARPGVKPVGGTILITAFPAQPAMCVQQLCSVDPTGKNVKVLTSTASLAAASQDCAGGCTAYNGSFSHNGSRIVFTSSAAGSGLQSVWVMNADGTHLRAVTTSAEFSEVSQATFSPNGKVIAFTGVAKPSPAMPTPTSSPLIWSVNTNGTGLHVLTNPQIRSFASQSAWSPTGAKIAFVSFDGRDASGAHANPSGIYIMNANGTGIHRITAVSPDPEQGETWAPNGKWLVFSKLAANWQTTNIATLVRINADGTGERQITPARKQYNDAWPVVSPDGTKIVFNRWHGPDTVRGSGHAYIMNADGTEARQLPIQAFPESWTAASPK